MAVNPNKFKVGDRVRVKSAVRERMHHYGDPDWPACGYVTNTEAQSLIWVRDRRGGEWGLPATELEHICEQPCGMCGNFGHGASRHVVIPARVKDV